MNRLVLFSILVAIGAAFVSLVWQASGAPAQKIRSLAPDLAFHLICEGKERAEIENGIEKFMTSEGFQVLNRGRLQRQHNVFLLDTDIVSLDKKRRIIDVIKLPPPSVDRYAVRLLSPPPTSRSPALEDTLLAFVSNKLGCQVRQVSRNLNGAEVADLYDGEIKRIEGLFRQAEELQGRRRT